MEDFKQVDVHRVKQMLEEGGVSLVDVRDQAAYQDGHIKGAVLLDDSNVKDFLVSAAKNTPLICYCYHGFSSQGAAAYFKKNGFNEVYSMEGGFEEWKKHYPSES